MAVGGGEAGGEVGGGRQGEGGGERLCTLARDKVQASRSSRRTQFVRAMTAAVMIHWISNWGDLYFFRFTLWISCSGNLYLFCVFKLFLADQNF